jgi:ribosomal protein L37E
MVGTRRSSRLSGKEDKDLAELPMTPVSKRKTPAKKASTAAASTKKADADADATTTKKVEKKKMDDDAKTPASKKEKEGTAKAKKPLPATSEKQSSKKGKDDASSKEKAATTTAPTMGDIAAKEKRKRDEIQQSQQQQQQHEHHHHNHHHGNKKKKKQQTQVQIERGLEKKKKKKSKKARKREREALAAKEAGEDGNAAKKTKITPTTTETAVNGTTKWSFGDWTCRKCGAHNYRKQKDKCFRCSYPKAIETNMKQGNHAAREYLKGKLKDDKDWTFSNQEHEWCVRNASFDPLMKDEVYDLFLKYLEKVEAKHRDRVRDGANAVIERMKRALSVLEKFPTHEEEKDAKRAIFTEGLSGPDGEKKKKKKKRNRKKKKKDKDEEAPEKSAGVEGKESEEAKK